MTVLTPFSSLRGRPGIQSVFHFSERALMRSWPLEVLNVTTLYYPGPGGDLGFTGFSSC